MKKVAASLIIFTKLPHKGLVAILNKRGTFDFEKFKPESYPGFYEPTSGGIVDSSEHLIEGLLREIGEEMGTATAKLVKHFSAQLQHVALHDDKRITSYTYALFIPHFPIALLKPHRGSAGIKIVTQKDIDSIQQFAPDKQDKKLPPPDDRIWMLADHRDGLFRGFAIYEHL